MKPKLLIVEDEEPIRTQLTSALRDDFTLFFAEDRAFEAFLFVSGVIEEKILRAGFRISRQAEIARVLNFLQCVVTTEVNDVDGRIRHLRNRKSKVAAGFSAGSVHHPKMGAIEQQPGRYDFASVYPILDAARQHWQRSPRVRNDEANVGIAVQHSVG